jgi:hypothetical protein
MREQRGQRRLVVQAVDTRELIAQGHEARRLDTRLVHERTIEVRELARLAAVRAAPVDALSRRAAAAGWSRTAAKVFQAERSAGIGVAASHLPLANCQKSCCGGTAGSIADMSTPERGCSARAAPATARPIDSATKYFRNIAAR